MSGENLNIDNSSSNIRSVGTSAGVQKRSELRILFGELFSSDVTGSDIGRRMRSGGQSHHYTPMEIANGLKSAFADSTISVVESEKFQEFINSIDETNVEEVYKMFSQISLTALIADDAMSSVDVRKESIMKIYDAFAQKTGIVDFQEREQFQAELNNQFKRMGFMVKTDKLDQMLQSMIKS